MEGVTDATMRSFLTALGGYRYCVTEFIRISNNVPSERAFRKHVPELQQGGLTPSRVPVQVQLLGGDVDLLTQSALSAVAAGATAVDINFGCPAPIVNRHDGGAALLKYPDRIYNIINTLRMTLPRSIPVSAKLRLGFENPEDIFFNAQQVERAGADWITIHARTKIQGYRPPAHWHFIAKVRERLNIPVVANGDIWDFEAFKRCHELTKCQHFMLGRSALANPFLAREIDHYLNRSQSSVESADRTLPVFWSNVFQKFASHAQQGDGYVLSRIKMWVSMISISIPVTWGQSVKRAQSLEEVFEILNR